MYEIQNFFFSQSTFRRADKARRQSCPVFEENVLVAVCLPLEGDRSELVPFRENDSERDLVVHQFIHKIHVNFLGVVPCIYKDKEDYEFFRVVEIILYDILQLLLYSISITVHSTSAMPATMLRCWLATSCTICQ